MDNLSGVASGVKQVKFSGKFISMSLCLYKKVITFSESTLPSLNSSTTLTPSALSSLTSVTIGSFLERIKSAIFSTSRDLFTE